ncbi:MAG: alkaline phosphatase family protein [Deltaproteobacteria bacterium]|nr:alkaline phosphatase family protein [Deltaproteobacteria bacterium]
MDAAGDTLDGEEATRDSAPMDRAEVGVPEAGGDAPEDSAVPRDAQDTPPAEDSSADAPDAALDAAPDAAMDGAMDAGSDTPRDAGTDAARDAPDGDARGDAPDGDAPDADPPPPVFPARIGHLTLAIRTGDGAFDGTDDNTLSVCLTATRCFPLNVLDVDDFRRGEIDVYHFEGVDLPRASVDRVEVRSARGADAWRPTCIEMQWDGEPVHCADGLRTLFGNGGAGEVERWTDPAGVHRGCVTCYPSVLTHGPVVGAQGSTAAQVMVRTDATRRVALRVTDTTEPATPERRLVAWPAPENDFTQRFALTGLAPDHGYSAAVEIDGRDTMARARFRTPPREGAPVALRLAFGSCSRDFAQPIFNTIAAQRPELFVLVGDNHYANSPDLQSLWWFYRRSLEVPERGRLLAATPSLAIWDDHDFVGNNTDRTSPGRASALRAFQDYMPVPSYGQPADPGVYHRASHGDVDLFLLDVRYGRDPPGPSSAVMVTERQMAWLEGELRRSTATFKLLASGTIFSPTGGESWLEYPASRNRLFDFIRVNRVTGVVLLAGDIHRSHLRRIHRTGTGAYDLPEVVSSPLANSSGACPASAEPDAAQVACFGGANSFAVLDIDTRLPDPRVIARLLDERGVERGRMVLLRSALR